MKHLKQLAGDVQQWAEANPDVTGLMWYGSFARGDCSATSDLDAAVLHGDGVSAQAVMRSLMDFMGQRVAFSSIVPGRHEATLWVDPALVKVDIHFSSRPQDFAWLADSPDIVPPRLVAAVDKTGLCRPLVERARALVPRCRATLVNEEIEKFLVGFEACSAAHRRSDGYQFYFHYNLALHRLGRLVELSRGESVYLFLPKFLLSKRLTIPEQNRWRELRGTIYLPEGNGLKTRLAETFMATVNELAGRGLYGRDLGQLSGFLDAVLARDLFFNVRDFADAFSGAVGPRQLFRTSTLTRWQDEPALARWLAERNVRVIVDFRHPMEAAEAKSRYPEKLLQRIRHVSLPLSGPPKLDAVPRPQEAGHGYFRLFMAHRANVVAALRIIAENGDGSTVVHCHVGKDRTGWFCATVGLLLGLDEEQLCYDYMLSGQGVAVDAIQSFLSSVQSGGGAFQLLSEVGFSDDDRQRLRARLLTTRRQAS